MIVVMPLAIGQYPAPGVLDGIRAQSVPSTPVLCFTNGVINSQRNYSPERTIGEVSSRKLSQDNASGKYVLSIDRDIVLEDRNTVSDMVSFLGANSDVVACAVYFGKVPKRKQNGELYFDLPHVDLKCVLFRTEFFKSIEFNIKDRCTCLTVRNKALKQNKIYRFIDFKKRAKEDLPNKLNKEKIMPVPMSPAPTQPLFDEKITLASPITIDMDGLSYKGDTIAIDTIHFNKYQISFTVRPYQASAVIPNGLNIILDNLTDTEKATVADFAELVKAFIKASVPAATV
jgi:hypothetical protein